jgi:hypothetical protein
MSPGPEPGAFLSKPVYRSPTAAVPRSRRLRPPIMTESLPDDAKTVAYKRALGCLQPRLRRRIPPSRRRGSTTVAHPENVSIRRRPTDSATLIAPGLLFMIVACSPTGCPTRRAGESGSTRCSQIRVGFPTPGIPGSLLRARNAIIGINKDLPRVRLSSIPSDSRPETTGSTADTSGLLRMRASSVCRHLKIAGRIAISGSFRLPTGASTQLQRNRSGGPSSVV